MFVSLAFLVLSILICWYAVEQRKWGLFAIGSFVALISRWAFIELVRQRIVFSTNMRPLSWLRARWGWGKSVEELARRLGVASDELRSAKPSYRAHVIKKRSGGNRLLQIPDAGTKALQRRILRRLLHRLHAHPVACGFERHKSIVDNALPHTAKKVVIKIDVIDFFPRTQATRVDAYFRRIGWNREAAALLTRLTTHDNGLPQGAPTSPRLSNLVNYYLDVQMVRFVASRKGHYTRYADDITISFPRDYPRHIRGTIQKIRELLRSRGYEIHRRKKLLILRSHQRQMVTGLVVNSQVGLPRERRRWLRAVEHHQRQGRAMSIGSDQLQGWQALRSMIEQHRGDAGSS